MERCKKKVSAKTKIVVATTTVIFSLASMFSGTYAWFVSNTMYETTSDSFAVFSRTYDIDSIHLYKYNYAPYDSGGGFEYLFPEKGSVNLYRRTLQDTFVDVDDNVTTTSVMNLYDPLQKIISGDSFQISELNTNAIYKIVLNAPSAISSAKINVSAFLKTPRSERVNDGSSYYLSDYVDFDVFTEEEISAIAINNTDWYPDYDNAPEAMAGSNKFTGSGNPSYCEGETIGSVYEDEDTGAFWVKESYGWEVEESLANTGAPNSAYSAPYYINITNNKVYVYDENIVDHTYGNYREITPTFNNQSSLPGNSGSIDDLYYYHAGSAHQIYKRVSNGWKKRSNVDYEELYYKVSYLASLNNCHSHFYNLLPLEKVSLRPNNDLYFYDEDEESWVKIDDYAEDNNFSYSEGMGEPNHNRGNTGDRYYDNAGNALYIKNSDGGWKLKDLTGKASSIANPNVSISYSGSNNPWSHDFGDNVVSKGNTYLYTGGSGDAVYLYVGTEEAGEVAKMSNWELQSVSYDEDSDFGFVSGELGDYYVYTANEMGSNGDLYLDTTNRILYIKGTTWERQINVFVGEEAPAEGDYLYFIDEDDNSLYRKVSGNWNSISPTFIRGSSPQSLYLNNGGGDNPWSLISPNIYGKGVPQMNTGNDNNVYLDTSTNNVYVKSDDGGWEEYSVGLNSETQNSYYVDLSANPKTFNFVTGNEGKRQTTIYINVNYAPSQLDEFSDLLQKSENLDHTFRAYLDFGFSFSFSEEVSG